MEKAIIKHIESITIFLYPANGAKIEINQDVSNISTEPDSSLAFDCKRNGRECSITTNLEYLILKERSR